MTSFSLEQISVSKPCPVASAEVAAEERARFCGHCQKSVYNLSAMTRAEAEKIVCEAAGAMCVQYVRDDAGAIVTLDYQPVPKRSGWRAAAVISGLIAGALSLAGVRNLSAKPVMRGEMMPNLPATQPAPSTQPDIC